MGIPTVIEALKNLTLKNPTLKNLTLDNSSAAR